MSTPAMRWRPLLADQVGKTNLAVGALGLCLGLANIALSPRTASAQAEVVIGGLALALVGAVLLARSGPLKGTVALAGVAAFSLYLMWSAATLIWTAPSSLSAWAIGFPLALLGVADLAAAALRKLHTDRS